MKKILLCGLIAGCCAAMRADASVTINEVAWMGTLPKEGESAQAAANNEWIELFNSGDESVILDGWHISAEDLMPDIKLAGSIAPHGYFLLERGSDDVINTVRADFVYPYKNNALSNSGEHVFLKNAAGEIIDELNFAGGWPGGDNTTKETMQRAGADWVTATGTPRALNKIAVLVSSPNQSPPAQTASPNTENMSASVAKWYVTPLKVYGGDDMRAAVGTLIEFAGYANGLDNKAIEARFIWNFGDGETKEGRFVTHIYRIPGTYTVSLSAASGEHTAADYHVVEVVPNQIAMGNVLEGGKGFIRFVNNSSVEIDISGWLVDDGDGKRFVIPSHTKLAPRADIALANEVTGLLQGAKLYPVMLMFPNAIIALQKFSNPAGASSVTASSTAGTTIVPAPVAIMKKAPATLDTVDTVRPAEPSAVTPPQRAPASSSAAYAALESSASPSLFFGVAFMVSLAGAFAFLAVKKFLL